MAVQLKNTKEMIEENNLYEIYVFNDVPVKYPLSSSLHPNGIMREAGEVDGWDIKWILAPNDETIKKYPFFDVVISKNDNSTGRVLTAEIFTGE